MASQPTENSDINSVKVDVEYCGSCNYGSKFEELMKTIKGKVNDAEVVGSVGRRGSFEVQINGKLVHSKLSTMAFPDFVDVANIAATAGLGNDVKQAKQAPITDCVLS